MSDQTAPPEGTVVTEPAAEAVQDFTPSGPWARDLQATFADPELQRQVDGFLREKVQPHVTRLEQQQPPAEAAQLYNDLMNEPGTTWYEITEELFGEDLAEQMAAAVRGVQQEEQPAPAEQENSALSREDREILDWVRNSREATAYDQALAQFSETHTEVPVKANLFHPFVVAADGKLEVAYEGYKEWLQAARDEGVLPTQAGAEEAAEDTTTPPPTLGSQNTGTTPPPTVPNAMTLDEGIDSLMADMRRAKEAPPVGRI